MKESLPADFATGDALRSLRELRAFLRRGFERVASGTALSDRELKEDWISPLEALVQKAPLAYRVIGNALIPVPQGAPADALAALTALDALRLVSTGALSTVRRCANPHCVLLFLDSSGRRKWCSMRLCGNRMKVARHQSRKGLVRKE